MTSPSDGRFDSPEPQWPLFAGSEFSDARLSAALRQSIALSREALFDRQDADGYWVGELEGDSILQSETVLLLAFLGWHDLRLAAGAARRLLETQRAEGGWSQYPRGPIDASASVKAYFALKLVGYDPSSEPMQRARRAILAAGGADAVNSFTRYYLALLGQISYDQCPAVPPEFVLAPRWFPVNLYRISAWSRTIFVPLSLVWAYRPVRRVDPRRGIRELFLREPKDWPPLVCPGKTLSAKFFSWDRFFRRLDRSIKQAERCRFTPLRRRAIDAAKTWMFERFEKSDGLGAIFPPIIWSIVALRAMGYADDSEPMRYNLQQLESLAIEEGPSIRLQPCKSPVWDTALSLRALAASGAPSNHSAVERATRWMLDREATEPGDWSKTVRAAAGGGWYFEHANEFYPDVDDTAMVLIALGEQLGGASIGGESLIAQRRSANLRDARRTADALDRANGAIRRGLAWTRAMQNRDGGWGAFDRNNDRELLCRVPFADHNAMIDPSTPDLTARVLEALAAHGARCGDRAVDRAVAYLRKTQQADGSWFGRWGVNYIYGTWQTIVGLAAVGVGTNDHAVANAVNWIVAHQNSDGGWGESPDSYADPSLRGQGPTTASQTAWALLGLMAGGAARHPAIERGLRWLIESQNDDGVWNETEFTGVGFPLVFYLRYHMYPHYFPLLALSRAAEALGVELPPVDEAGFDAPFQRRSQRPSG
jgi:squalene-hopene/tetraprenyl-beta-curcumene cyclase